MIACEKEDDDENNQTSEFVENEPNGTFGTASELTMSDIYDAEINPAQDQDYFYIESTSNVTITIDGDSSLELYIYVYDENQTNIYTGDTGARGASLSQTISSSDFNGKLYIMIESAYPDDTGSYTIVLN